MRSPAWDARGELQLTMPLVECTTLRLLGKSMNSLLLAIVAFGALYKKRQVRKCLELMEENASGNKHGVRS